MNATAEPEPTATAEPEPTATEEPEPLPLIPEDGPWRVVNQSTVFLCGGTSIEVAETVEEGSTITVLDDGETLFVSDFSDDTTDLNMYRTAASPASASYAGDITIETPEGTITNSFSVTFNSPTRFDGDVVGTVSGGGILCEPDDPTALADALERILLDHDEAQRLADAGRRAVVDHFNSDRMARSRQLP